MQSVSSNISDPILENVPAWKKELIIRRRSNNARTGPVSSTPGSATTSPTRSIRSIQSPTGMVQLATERSVGGPYYCSVEGPEKQLAECSVRGPGILDLTEAAAVPCFSSSSECNGGGALLSYSRPNYNESGDECLKGVLNSGVTNNNKNKMHHKSYEPGRGGGLECNEVDLEYGPGIVSKLKNRYMSLAMRDAKSRPALRRFSSLEDLLDAEEAVVPTSRRGRTTTTSSNKREAMKRARSVDCLTAARNRSSPVTNGSQRNSLSSYSRQDVIIIEATDDEKHLKTPPEEKSSPLKLRSIKTVYEQKQNGNNISTDSQSSQPFKSYSSPRDALPMGRGVISPTSHNPRSPHHKPLPKAKPAGLMARRPESITEAKVFLKQVTPLVKTNSSKVTNGVGTPIKTGVIHAPKSLKSATGEPLKSPLGGSRPLPTPPPSISSMRSQKSIESTRVLLENRKNAQKSRRPEESPLKASDMLTPKAVVLVEADDSSPTVTKPPALPLRNVSNPPTVAISPIPRLTSPKSPPMLSPIASTSSKQILSPFPPCHTSTPNQSSPTSEMVHACLAQSPVPHKLPPPSHKQIAPSPPILSHTKSKNFINNKSVPPPAEPLPPVRPSTRPPSPPLQRNHFVSLKASAPKVTPSPPSSVETSPTKKQPVSPHYAGPPPLSTRGITKERTSPSVERGPALRSTKVTSFSSTSDEVTEVIEAVNTKATSKSTKDQRWHQDQTNNSLVFNFIGASSTPDYIENDGVDISKRVNKQSLDSGYVKLPGYDECDSSTDDWDELTPAPLRIGDKLPPCPFMFEGDAVIIRGRSNLQRQPRSKKLAISFNDTLTKTFEYPSEASLIEDPDTSDGLMLPSHGSGLASYTPSKLALGDAFELGVSRTIIPPPPTSKRQPPEGEEGVDGGMKGEGEEYLRPAGEEETVTWSAGGTADMLF